MGKREEAKLRNVIIDNTENHLAEGYKLVNLLNRNGEYVVCDLTLNDEINDSDKMAVFNLVSPFNLMFMNLQTKIEFSLKTRKPLLVYGLPNSVNATRIDDYFSLRVFEYTYLCSLLFPMGFVRIEVVSEGSGKSVESCFPTIRYNPSSMFLVDLMEQIDKKYMEECSGNIATLIGVLHNHGFYLSMTSNPKSVVKMSGYGPSTEILPYEYFSKVFGMMDENADNVPIEQMLKETAFVRAHSPLDAIVSMKESK